MTSLVDAQTPLSWRSVGPPPIPREHGAWMMLYLPLVVALIAFRPVPLGPAFLLVLAVTSAFFAQQAAGLVLRRRSANDSRFWLAAYSALLAASAGGLLLVYGLGELVWIGLPAALLFSFQLWLRQTTRKRLNHSRMSEIAAIGVFALTAPAAGLVARGELLGEAWWLWGSCLLYFSSSVFYVRLLVDAARSKEPLSLAARWQVGRGLLLYHLLLAGLLTVLFYARIETAYLFALAYAPALLRALWGWLRLTNRLPSLKRVGVQEILYSLWFAGWLLAALRPL